MLPDRLSLETADGYVMQVFQPRAHPLLWEQYLEGAEREYRRFDVLAALPLDELRATPENVALGFLILDDDGSVIGGVRTHGPHQEARQVTALMEMADSPDAAKLKAHFERCMENETVIEVKGTWSDFDHAERRALVASTTRCVIHSMDLFAADRVFGTAPEHTLKVYCSTGAVVIEEAGSSAYPDDRYRTRALEWTATGFATVADPVQLASIRKERAAIVEALAGRS